MSDLTFTPLERDLLVVFALHPKQYSYQLPAGFERALQSLIEGGLLKQHGRSPVTRTRKGMYWSVRLAKEHFGEAEFERLTTSAYRQKEGRQ